MAVRYGDTITPSALTKLAAESPDSISRQSDQPIWRSVGKPSIGRRAGAGEQRRPPPLRFPPPSDAQPWNRHLPILGTAYLSGHSSVIDFPCASAGSWAVWIAAASPQRHS